MSQEPTRKGYVIEADHLAALQEFIGSLSLPWKQTNPYMQILISAQEVVLTSPQSAPEVPANKTTKTKAVRKKATAK